MNNMNPEAAAHAVAKGWGNVMVEAYTGNLVGHRAVRSRLKVDIAPQELTWKEIQ